MEPRGTQDNDIIKCDGEIVVIFCSRVHVTSVHSPVCSHSLLIKSRNEKGCCGGSVG